MMLLVVCTIRGFDDLLIPLRDANAVDITATTAGHSITVFDRFYAVYAANCEILVNSFTRC